MEENVYLDKLERRDIKPTAIRLLILKNMLEVGRAVSLLDLETPGYGRQIDHIPDNSSLSVSSPDT